MAFVYVSDDMKWAEEKLLPRVKTKDLFLAGMLMVRIYVLRFVNAWTAIVPPGLCVPGTFLGLVRKALLQFYKNPSPQGSTANSLIIFFPENQF